MGFHRFHLGIEEFHYTCRIQVYTHFQRRIGIRGLVPGNLIKSIKTITNLLNNNQTINRPTLSWHVTDVQINFSVKFVNISKANLNDNLS